MTNRQPVAGQPASQPSKEQEEKRNRRRMLLLFLLLLLVPVCLWLVSQIALLDLGMDEANESLLSQLQATYMPWGPSAFGPLNPTLIGTIRAEQATFAAGGGGVGILVPFVPGQPGQTQIAANPSATPGLGTSIPTRTATPLPPSSTPIIIFYPATSTSTFAAPPTAVDTPGTPAPTDIPPKPTRTPSPGTADLGITKDDGTLTYIPGAALTYTITVSNVGPMNVNNARVQDTFPAAITSDSWTCAASAGSSCPAGGSGNINVTVDLLTGGSATFTVSASVGAGATGNLTNMATVTPPAGTTDPNAGNNSASDTDTQTPPQADLAITKDDSKTKAWPGGPLTYTITVTNSGPSAANNATVTDTFAGVNTVAWTCAPSGGATCTASGTGNITDSVDLPSGSQVIYTVTLKVNAAPATGTLSNTASVAAPVGITDTNPGNNSATDNDTIGKPDVVITLAWTSTDTKADFDLWVYDPSAPDPLINSYGGSTSGGMLTSGDLNCVPALPFSPQEQITWPAGTGPLLGTYDVYAFYYNTCPGTSNTVTWTVTVTVDGVLFATTTGSVTGDIDNPSTFPVVPPQIANVGCPGTLVFPGAAPPVPASCTFVPADPRSDGNPTATLSFTLP